MNRIDRVAVFALLAALAALPAAAQNHPGLVGIEKLSAPKPQSQTFTSSISTPDGVYLVNTWVSADGHRSASDVRYLDLSGLGSMFTRKGAVPSNGNDLPKPPTMRGMKASKDHPKRDDFWVPKPPGQ